MSNEVKRDGIGDSTGREVKKVTRLCTAYMCYLLFLW